MAIRTAIHHAIRATGYDVHKVHPPKLGDDLFVDAHTILGRDDPVIFDIGANDGGLFMDRLLEQIPSAHIHAFEPGEVFQSLKAKYGQRPNTELNNCAMGATEGRQQFFENSVSYLNSFLPLGPEGWGEVVSQGEVCISTIDSYCEKHGIETIDLLKTDTQGHDLEVLKGAGRMMREKRIRLIHIEITLAKIYENVPRMDHLCGFLADRGFEIISFYDFNYHKGRLGWFDALFVQDGYMTR